MRRKIPLARLRSVGDAMIMHKPAVTFRKKEQQAFYLVSELTLSKLNFHNLQGWLDVSINTLIEV